MVTKSQGIRPYVVGLLAGQLLGLSERTVKVLSDLIVVLLQ